MKYIKTTKKYNVYEVSFEGLGEFVIKDPLSYEDKYKLDGGVSDGRFSIVKIESKTTRKKSQSECSQADTLSDLKSDIEKIKSGKINGTVFYRSWMKTIFEKGKTYELDIKGINKKGVFKGEETFKKRTFNFVVDSKKIKANTIKFNGYQL